MVGNVGVADSRVMSRDLPGEGGRRMMMMMMAQARGACNAGCDLLSLVRPKFSSEHLPAQARRQLEKTESRILSVVA